MATPSESADAVGAAHEMVQEAAKAAEGGGLPQLDVTAYPTQIFWLVVGFVVLYQLMAKVALPRIAQVLEERADAIADELDRAEEFRRKAAEAEAAYEQALAEARARAQAIANETRARIQKEIDAAMARADAEIAERVAESEKRIAEIRASAAEAVREVAEETARTIIETILPETLDAEAVKAAVAARVS